MSSASSSRNATRVTIYPPETPASELPALLTATQAGAWLDRSRKKVARLISSGTLRPVPNEADKRFRLVRREDVVRVRAADLRFMDPAKAS